MFLRDLSALNENSAEMILNEFGVIANKQLGWLENHYSYVVFHQYGIMPNHIHVVIDIYSLRRNKI